MTLQLHSLLLVLSLFLQVSAGQEVRTLEAGKAVEREIADGQSHTYLIKLSAGQFMRAVAVQRGSNLVIGLVGPDAKEIREANFSSNYGGQESLSYQATEAGEYRLSLRTFANPAPAGGYELRLEVKAGATAEDSRRIQAERLLMEGLKSIRQANYQPGIEIGLEVLPLWREVGDLYWQADTLSLLGSAHNSLRKFEQAAQYFQQVLLLRRQIKDRPGESNALADLGVVCQGQNQYEQWLAYSNQALEIKRELNDRVGEARDLYQVAVATFRLGKYAQVVSYLDQLMAIYPALDDKTGIGNAYNLRGNCHYNLGQYDEAISNYEKALEYHRQVKNRAAESLALHNLGLVKRQLGQFDAALELYEKSLAIKRELKDRLNEGLTLSAVGNLLTQTGEYEEAVSRLDAALSIARELKDASAEANTNLNIGLLQQKLGQTKKAYEYLQTAVTIAQSLKNPFLMRQVYIGLAELYYELGAYEKDLEYREKILAIDRESKNRQSEIVDLINISSDYRSLGRYDRALEIQQQALALSREIKSPAYEAFALANLGLVYTVQGDYQQAIGYHQQAIDLFRNLKIRRQEGRILINLGECYLKLGRLQEAIELSSQALALMRETRDQDGESISLGNLGAAYSAAGQFEKAAESLSRALELARQLKNADRLREALNELARLERNQGNLAAAIAYLEQSLKSLESSRREIYSPQSRATFLAAEQQSLRLYIDLLMRRHRAEPDKGLDALAVEVSERGRARVLLELLGEARIDIRQDVDSALVAQEQALGQKVNIWAARLDLASKPELVARLKQELSQLETDYERVQVEIRKASPRYAALTQPQPLKLKEIQAQLDPETLLLEYALGEERSYLWAITRETLASYELPKGEQIKQSALQVYEMLTARSTTKRGGSARQRQQSITQAEANLPAAAAALSQTILSPVAALIGSKRLVIVADGALQYIPFAMLPTPVVGSQSPVAGNNATANRPPLIVNHEIVSLPSASALAIQRTELAGRPPAPKLLAVIADPVFDRTDARFKSLAPETNDKAQRQTLAFNDARSLEHLADKSDDKAGTTSRLVIPRLPFTRQEATRLLALTPKNSSFGAIDYQASRATVLSGELSQYRYIHFATHGLLDTERPGLSSLVLSMVDAEGKVQDGFLRANDIYNLKLPAELVVLSACQTGLGKEIKGEGLVGLTRGFMYAGAARVVVSLWNVNDKATAELMTKFYEKMLRQGARPAAALRAAQVEMWKQRQWQSPYYWAAFTLQGEWR